MRSVQLAILVTILSGCTGTQDYQRIAPDTADSALTTSDIVLEGHLTNSQIGRRARASAWQVLTFWDPLPVPAKPGPPEWNATIEIENARAETARRPRPVRRERRGVRDFLAHQRRGTANQPASCFMSSCFTSPQSHLKSRRQ
jgi:hypothetical protein